MASLHNLVLLCLVISFSSFLEQLFVEAEKTQNKEQTITSWPDYRDLFEHCGEGPLECMPVRVNRYQPIDTNNRVDKTTKSTTHRPLYHRNTTKRASKKLLRTKRLIGAERAPYGQLPWTAAIMLHNNYLLCAGALIGRRYVATSAHCLHNLGGKDLLDSKNLTVHLGRHKIGDEYEAQMQTFNISNFCIHKDYTLKNLSIYTAWNGISNDLAILHLDRNVDYTQFIRPICLPDPLMEKPSYTMLDKVCFIGGWGDKKANWTAYNDGKLERADYLTPADTLRIIGYKVRPKCGRYKHGWQFHMKDKSVLCYDPWPQYVPQDDDVGVCHGDRGDPLTCFDRQVKRYVLNSLVTNGTPHCLRFGGSAYGTDMWNLKYQTIDMVMALRHYPTDYLKYCKDINLLNKDKLEDRKGLDDWHPRIGLIFPNVTQEEPPDY